MTTKASKTENATGLVNPETGEIPEVARPTDAIIQAQDEQVSTYLYWLEERQRLLETALEAKPGSEARGIAWFDLFGKVTQDGEEYTVKVNLTQRSDVDAVHAMQAGFNAIRFAKGYHMNPYQKGITLNGRYGKAPEQAGTPAQAQAPAPAAPGAPSAPPAPGTPAQAPTTEEQQMVIEKMNITPKAGGKVDIELFAPGHQYGDLFIKNFTVDSVLKMFPEGWEAGHFAVANTYAGLNLIAVWKNSTKVNSKGNPYRDIIRLEYPE